MHLSAIQPRAINARPHVQAASRYKRAPHRRGGSPCKDSSDYSQALALRAYVGADPINMTDPDGREATCVANGNCFGDPNDPETHERERRAGTGLAVIAGVAGAAALVRTPSFLSATFSTARTAVLMRFGSEKFRSTAIKFADRISDKFNRNKPQGLSDAVRRELATGEQVGGKSHLVKGREAISWTKNQLDEVSKNNSLSRFEKSELSRTLKGFADELREAFKTTRQ